MLDEGEELTSPRVVDAVAPGAVVMYHAMYERGGAAVVDAVPGGRGWREAVEAHPENERHLAIHEGHLVKANPRDEPYVADLIPMARAGALTGTAEQVAARVRDFAAAGVTVMPPSEPVRLPTTVSVAVIDLEPAVFSVAAKLRVPASLAVKV